MRSLNTRAGYPRYELKFTQKLKNYITARDTF